MLPPLRHIAPRLADVRQRTLNFLTPHSGLILCGLFLLAGLNLAGDYGLGVDELLQRRIAQYNLDYILGPDRRIAAEMDVDRVYSVAFELPLLLLERALGVEDFYYAHRLRVTLTHLLFIAGGYFCYLLAYRLFNNRWLALFALLLFLLHPRIYGHSFFNAKDLPFLSLFVIALYLLERAFRRDTPGAFMLLGLAVGLLTNFRIMGAALAFAVLGMRGLDWFQSGSQEERKAILRKGGLFLLTAGLALYAVTPYAWLNPIAYLRESVELAVNHPSVSFQLFQGEWIPADRLPPHYNAVWFGITTPLPIILLGGLGAAAVAAQGLRRPGKLFRNNRRRVQALLLAGFLLPPLAVALLSSHQYDDWRHLYFIYGPFCLLAAGGLGWLAGWARRRRGQVGVYGLAGLGLGLALLQMAQLHPLQNFYFNSLVDRATPEYLRTQYQLRFGQLGYWAGLRRILENHPGETLTVRTDRWSKFALLPWGRLSTLPWDEFAPLPAADRGRLRPAPAAGGQADYVLNYPLTPSQPDRAFNTVAGRVYNNATADLRPLDSARMSGAAVAAYREIYRQAVAGEPVIQADYNVYRNGQRLTFVQENCPADQGDVRFDAAHFPQDRDREPAPPGETSWYLSQRLSNYGVRVDDLCLAVLDLPAAAARGYLILSRHQLGPAGPPAWSELLGLSPPGPRERIARWREELPPPPAPAFEVYLDPAGAGYRLLYAKKDCTPEEYETRVFLHILPKSLGDLPFYLWASGMVNRDFALRRHGVRSAGECRAVFPLPDYPIASLLTGQAGAWVKRLYPPKDPDTLRAAQAALAGRPPAARSNFALYIQDNQLTYWRESCAATDTAANFFLHLTPRNTADLPADRQQEGYANLDFAFARYGGPFDGQCLAAVPLPDYPIAAIRTGQPASWEVNLYPPADPDYLRAAHAALSGAQPAARATFNLYLQNSQLTYLRETCAPADLAANFFLHIIPRNVADLPADRQAAGFANRDFAFNRYGGPFDGQCLAAVPLPDYPIKTLRTGQFIPGQGELWAAELTPAR